MIVAYLVTSQKSRHKDEQTTIFILHIKTIFRKDRDKWDGCWDCFSRGSALSCWHLKSIVILLLEYSCQLWHPWNEKYIKAIEAIQRTFTYKITELQDLNYSGKDLYSLHTTQIILPPQTPWKLYNYIYLEGNTAYGTQNEWYNGTQNRNQKTSSHVTVCHSVLNE